MSNNFIFSSYFAAFGTRLLPSLPAAGTPAAWEVLQSIIEDQSPGSQWFSIAILIKIFRNPEKRWGRRGRLPPTIRKLFMRAGIICSE
jgi:hypothetical protein